MLRTVAAFREPWEAHMLSSRLEAEGIPAFVAHEYHIGNAWHFSLCLGGVKVQVPVDDLNEARAVEALCRQGAMQAVLEREFGALEEVHCPRCGASEKWKRRPLPRACAAIAISLTIGIVLPPLGWVYYCEKCGAKYRAPLYVRPLREWLLIMSAILCMTAVLIAGVVLLLLALTSRYWFVTVVIAVLIAGRWLTRWISRLNAEIE